MNPPSKPVGVIVSPAGDLIYVALGGANAVAVIDARTSKVRATIPVRRRPRNLTLSRDGRLLSVANGLSNDLSVIDTRTRRVLTRYPVGRKPWGVALTY